jgi:predicted nuclease of predicted toxin-antitoxin system
MSHGIKFHLDEHVPTSIAQGLRREGIDVTTTVDAGLRTATDDAHLNFAIREKRVLVTHDHGFLRMARQGAPHYGIVYCKPRSRTLGEILRTLVELWRRSSAEQMKNRIAYVKRH